MLGRALATTLSLTNVCLSGAHIGELGACTLAASLCVNATIVSLDLGDNNIPDTGNASVVRSLQTNRTLQWLSLRNNWEQHVRSVLRPRGPMALNLDAQDGGVETEELSDGATHRRWASRGAPRMPRVPGIGHSFAECLSAMLVGVVR